MNRALAIATAITAAAAIALFIGAIWTAEPGVQPGTPDLSWRLMSTGFLVGFISVGLGFYYSIRTAK